MNIIEHAWDKVDRCLCARTPLPRNLNELWDVLVEKWVKLDISYVQNLYKSMPCRVAALLVAQGQYTKY